MSKDTTYNNLQTLSDSLSDGYENSLSFSLQAVEKDNNYIHKNTELAVK